MIIRLGIHQLNSRKFSSLPKSRWRSLVGFLAPEKAHIGGAVVALTATSGGTVAFPYFTGRLMDGFAQSSQSPEVWIDLVNTNALACIGALSLVGLGGFARAYLLETASEKISRKLRLDLFDALLRKPQSFFDSARTGDLVSRLGTDVTRVSRSIMDGAFGFRVLINAVAGTVMVANTVPLAIVPQLLAPVGFMFIGGVVYGRLVRGISKRQTEALSKSMQIAEEDLSLVRVVKLFNGEKRCVDDYRKSLDAVYSLAQSNALATGGRVTAFVTIGGGFILHVVYNCGMLITTGTLTIGQTSALAGYLLICGNAYQGLVTAYGDIQKALGSCDRFVHLMQPEVETAVTRPVVFSGSSITAPPSITFSDVHFNYSTGEAKEVLNGLHMHVPSGAKQAVVGLSGSGKSSILMLLAGMYPPTRGVIRLNDTVDLAGIDGHDLRDNIISFVPQETALFDTSIRDNVWFPNQPPVGTELATAEAALVDRARLSFVTDWSATVGERGQNLSGGERQRIAIARALSKPKPVLLLDEATSALDRESDAVILSHLSDLPSTILAVTHRMSAIEWSDRLTVVAGGRVVQEGSTIDLLKAPGPVLQRLLAQIDSSQH